MKTKDFDKITKRHFPTCTYWIFSGDRHCSCRRDGAIAEIEELKKVIAILVGVG